MIKQVENEPGGIDLVSQVQEIFSPTGLFSRAPGFEYRPQQQQMAMAVAEALQERRHLAVEAGTGVGKSLAYLVPAILYAVTHQRKAVISTHTINLQEQLTDKDLPMLKAALPVKFTFTMLKGRSNYLCTRRLHKAVQAAEGLFTSSETEELKRILEWSKRTEDGSLSDFEVEPDPKVWAQVCSERGICSPKACGHQSEFGKEHGVCFFQRVRSRVLAADVLVLNHTLFFTLLGAMDDEHEEGTLFKNDFVVFDEAHTIEAVASRHIGLSVSNAQIRFTLQRLYNPNTQKGLLALLRQGNCISMVNDLLEASEEFFKRVEQACDELAESMTTRQASDPESRSEGRRRGWTEMRIRRAELVPDNLTLPIQRLREAISHLIKMTDDKDTGQELIDCNRRLAELKEAVATFLGQLESETVYWVERSGSRRKNLTLSAAPIDVADFLRARLFKPGTSVILASATLSTVSEEPPPSSFSAIGMPAARHGRQSRGGLQYFLKRVGAERATPLQVGSPFDYSKQMKLYLVNKMPDPRDPAYRESLIHWIEHFVRLTHGKAFVLFTNSRLMQEIGECMAPFFEGLGTRCYIQGTGIPRSTMLARFKTDIDSVLFGTDSFWQGVDVPGEALSNVILTRLPFSVPDHPLIEARIERIEAQGGNAFFEFSLPEAILKFRQGVGRLIRSKSDTGIVVVLDNRILNKRYGEAFLKSIPKCPVEVI